MKKISSESEAVPPVSQNFVFSEQNFGSFFTGEIYMNFFYPKIHTIKMKKFNVKAKRFLL